MTSLAEAYEHRDRPAANRPRLLAGSGLVGVGAAIGVLALLVVSTDLFAAVVSQPFGARLAGGVLGGIAVPLALVGVFVVLPASQRVRAAAAISVGVCLLGVALFWHAYPSHWAGYGDDLTLLVSGVYLLGLMLALWSLFAAVVNFKTRNAPGGMLELNVVRRGRTKVVEVERGGGFGSVGLFGSTPDGSVETQTNRPGRSSSTSPSTAGSAPGSAASASDDATVTRSAGGSGSTGIASSTGTASSTRGGLGASGTGTAGDVGVARLDTGSAGSNASGSNAAGPESPGPRSSGPTAATDTPDPAASGSGTVAATSDGGSSTRDLHSPLDDGPGHGAHGRRDRGATGGRRSVAESADRYCGNCTHFQYVRDDGAIVPYCGAHDERMDDMDPCEEWAPNRS